MSRTERLAQPEVFGKYQLISRLAKGRLGDVYKAKVHGLEGFERIVVLKVFEQGYAAIPSFLEVLADEAQRVNMLAHTNIAQIFNFGIQQDEPEGVGQPFLVTEHVHGLDLKRARAICDKAGVPFPLELAVFMATEIAQGLDYAHRRKDYNFTPLGLMHYDLSPTNVMLSTTGDVKLTDFGTPRAIEELPVLDEQELVRRVLYRAPEAARGETYTQQSDLFSLGLMLYEVLAGIHPYLHGSPRAMDLYERAKQGSVPHLHRDLEHVPAPLVRIVESLLGADHETRCSNAGQAYEDLVGFLYGQNLQRADARALGLFVQDLRQDEQRLFEASQPSAIQGIREISLHEIEVPHIRDSLLRPRDPGAEASEPTMEALPQQKLQSLLKPRGTDASSETLMALPAALEEHFKEACAGQGKLVLLYGALGAGRSYIPDRLTDLLGARGNAEVHDIQAVRDDKVRPLGVLGDLLLSVLGAIDRAEPLRALREMGASDREVVAISGLRTLCDARVEELAPGLLLQAMFDASVRILKERSKRATLILLIDRASYIDPLSNLIVSQLVPVVATLPCLLLLTDQQLDTLQHQLPLPQEQAKHVTSVRINSSPHPTLRQLDALEGDLRDVLIPLGMLQRPMDHAQITQLVGWDSARVFQALRALVKVGIVRVPRTGIFFAAHADMDNWLKTSSTAEGRRRLVEQYTDIHGQDDALASMELLKLHMHALSGDRKCTHQAIERYASWLEFHGQNEILSLFYHKAFELFSDPVLSAPNLRLAYLIKGAELLLERATSARAQVGPMFALAEHIRDERGMVRSRLLHGEVLMKLDDLEEAHEVLKTCVEAAQWLGDPELSIKARLPLVTWLDRYGHTAEAMRTAQSALKLHEQWGLQESHHETYSRTLALLVHLGCKQGLLTLAQGHLATLSELSAASGFPLVLLMRHWAESTLAMSRGQDELADTHITRAMSLSKSYQYKALWIELSRRYADMALERGRHALALETLDDLITVSKDAEDVYNFQRAIEMRALAQCLASVDSQRALMTLEQALRRAQSRHVPKDMMRCHRYLSLALRATGQQHAARAHADQAALIAHSLQRRAPYAPTLLSPAAPQAP